MAPVPYRVLSRVVENADSVTLHLEPVDTALPNALPGEFMMLYAFGVGEVAIDRLARSLVAQRGEPLVGPPTVGLGPHLGRHGGDLGQPSVRALR